MKTHVVRIGNSQGIRIPKPLLEQTGLKGEVEITAQDDSLMIRPVRKPARRLGCRVPGDGTSPRRRNA